MKILVRKLIAKHIMILVKVLVIIGMGVVLVLVYVLPTFLPILMENAYLMVARNLIIQRMNVLDLVIVAVYTVT
jgi:hypothetical protein